MKSLRELSIDKSWTLFLDRDGVINERIVGDYVKRPEDFHFLPGVVEAIAQLSQVFGKIVVVTNQQGIGKGLYTTDDLVAIHTKMQTEITRGGGRIDAVFFAPNLSSENSTLRKPGIGMALQAQHIFPQIDFAKSVMVGDTESDMLFAQNAGMKSVFCSVDPAPAMVMAQVSSLKEFASYLSAL